MIKKASIRYLVLAILICISSTVAFAETSKSYDFYIFTDNGDWGTSGVNYGNESISVEVYNGLETAHFKITNNSDPLIGCSVTDIYFDDGSLLGISTIINQSGATAFATPAIPSELPENQFLDPDFITSNSGMEYFSADSNSPPYDNGVQTGEWVIIQFTLINGSTIEDVINEMDSGAIRVGLHVQGFTDVAGSSESAVNIPEPATIALLGLGSLALLRIRKR